MNWKDPYVKILYLITMIEFIGTYYTYAVLRKKQNPVSANGPPMIDGWVVRLSFEWSVNDIRRPWNQLKNWSKWANRYPRFIQTQVQTDIPMVSCKTEVFPVR